MPPGDQAATDSQDRRPPATVAVELRVAKAVPELPAHVVVQFFRYGGSVAEVLALAGLAGAELAKAKMQLPALRRECLSLGELDRSQPGLEAVREDLLWGRPAIVCRRVGPELKQVLDRERANTQSITELVTRQKEIVVQLSGIDERLVRSAASMVGAKAHSELIRQHKELIREYRKLFADMRLEAEKRYQILDEGTSFVDKLLFVAGYSVSSIHSAGGAGRTLRTVYNRTRRLTPAGPGHFPDSLITKAIDMHASLAEEEAALINFRRSIKHDLDALTRQPREAAPSARECPEGSWASEYWTPKPQSR